MLSATHKDLRRLIDAGMFREDLYYRLNVVPLRLPPLRARADDIAELAEHFLAKAAADGLPPPRRALAIVAISFGTALFYSEKYNERNQDPDSAADLTGVMCLVGSVFAFLSRYAAHFWNQGLHQGATISVAPGDRISSVYSYPLYLCMLGFFLLFVALLLVRTRTEIRRRRTAALAAREVRE